MKITNEFTDESIVREIGERLASARLERNLTQADLAREAGVSKRTLERLESGAAATQLSVFIRICRALNLLPRLDALIPQAIPSPVAQLKHHGRRRRRASGTRVEKTRRKKWTWGESS